MPLINLGRDLGHGHMERGHGLKGREHTGIVVDNKDPEKLQRVKIRVHDLHKDISDEDLPWSMHGQANTQHQGSGALGQVEIPPVNTKVTLNYNDDSMYHGYFKGTPTTTDTKIPEFVGKDKGGSDGGEGGGGPGAGIMPSGDWFDAEESNPQDGEKSVWEKDYCDNYPDVNGHVSADGSMTSYDAKHKTFEYTHVSGSNVLIDGKGNMKIRISKDGKGEAKLEKDDKKGGGGGGGQQGGGGGDDFLTTEKVKGIRVEAQQNTAVRTSEETQLYSGKKISIHTDDEVVIYAKANITILSDADVTIKGANVCIEGKTIRLVGDVHSGPLQAPSLTSTKIDSGRANFPSLRAPPPGPPSPVPPVEQPDACNPSKPSAPKIQEPKKRGDPKPKSKAVGNTSY